LGRGLDDVVTSVDEISELLLKRLPEELSPDVVDDPYTTEAEDSEVKTPLAADELLPNVELVLTPGAVDPCPASDEVLPDDDADEITFE
jgi:hypothetical protein